MIKQWKFFLCGLVLILGGIAVLYFLDQYAAGKPLKVEKNTKQVDEFYENFQWKSKIKTDQIFKIGIITDTQFHASRINRNAPKETAVRMIKPKYKFPIDSFLARMREFQPDKLAHLGDIIEGTSDQDYISIAGIKLVKDLFDKIGLETYWVIGNHELRSITREQFKETLSIDYLNKWFDVGDYRIIVLDSNFQLDNSPVVPGGSRYIRGHVSQENLNFLEEALKTKKRTIVLMHAPPFVIEDGVPRKIESGLLDNANEVQKLLEKYAATAVFGGHIERKRFIEKNGVQYFALPGTHKNKYYKNSYYEVTIKEDEVNILMHYVDINTGEYVAVDFKDGENLPYELRSKIDYILNEDADDLNEEADEAENEKEI